MYEREGEFETKLMGHIVNILDCSERERERQREREREGEGEGGRIGNTKSGILLKWLCTRRGEREREM